MIVKKIIEQLLQKNKNLKIAEIGVLSGERSKQILETIVNFSECHYWAIDWFKGYLDFPDDFGDINSILNDFLNNMSTYDKKMWTLFVGMSHECIKKLPDNMDIIFIDGSHAYSQVKKDIEASIVILKNGGILVGHDYCSEFNTTITYTEYQLEVESQHSHLGVTKAVLETIGPNNFSLDGIFWISQKINDKMQFFELN